MSTKKLANFLHKKHAVENVVWINMGTTLLAFLFLALTCRDKTILLTSTNSANAYILFLSELILVSITIIILSRLICKKSTHLAVLVIILITISTSLIYISQIFSLLIQGRYITVMALQNYTELKYITNTTSITITSLFAIFWLVMVSISWPSSQNTKNQVNRLPKTLHLFLILGITLTAIYKTSLSKAAKSSDLDYLPIVSLYKNLKDARHNTNNKAEPDRQRTSEDIKYAFSVNGTKEYPFQHRRNITLALPFEEKIKQHKKPNVIIIFAEGLSARWLGAYQSSIKGLTPNLDKLSSKFMIVDNYYNHTAATYRGIHGQLASGYPYFGSNMAGGWEITGSKENNAEENKKRVYQTLPKILKSKGYETHFFSAHNISPLHIMLESLGYDKITNFDNISQTLNREVEKLTGTDAATDDELFLSLSQFLRNRDQSKDQDPFLISTYNVGTHAFLKGNKNSKTYKSGKNGALNRIHQFDSAINLFLSYFFTSAYVDNTVLIITTDHATYAEPPVIAALKNEQNYQKHFVDMIPLLIHSPYHEMPERYDAKTRTSIDFTPSILHLLDIKKYESSFLGHSIFSPKKQNHIAVGAIGHNYYYINEKKEVVKVKPNQHINYGFERYKSAIKTYYDLEPNNKIYKE